MSGSPAQRSIAALGREAALGQAGVGDGNHNNTYRSRRELQWRRMMGGFRPDTWKIRLLGVGNEWRA